LLPDVFAVIMILRATAILYFLQIGARSQTSIKNVVFLGDSYSSGNDARDSSGCFNYDLQSGFCWRSPTTWGAQVSNMLGASYVNNACSGAKIADVDSQLDAITSKTDLVLLTVGFNDVGFTNIITRCFFLTLRNAAKCQHAIDFAVRYIPTIEADLTTALTKLSHFLNASDSKVILAAYPHFGLNVPFVYNDIIGGGSVEVTNQLRS
jgi:lysophospholipase L1-like esterase